MWSFWKQKLSKQKALGALLILFAEKMMLSFKEKFIKTFIFPSLKPGETFFAIIVFSMNDPQKQRFVVWKEVTRLLKIKRDVFKKYLN